MQRNPARTHRLAIAVFAGALTVLLALAGSASAGAAAPASGAPTRQAVARPGDFCTPASCRPRSAPLLTGAAFGATVLAIGWQARRRESREP